MADVPLIEALQKRDYYVITTGTNKNGLAHNYSDEYIYADYSNGDEIAKIMKDNDIVSIVSGCTDFSYIATSYVCEKLGLNGHDSLINAQIIHDKKAFKTIAVKYGANVPLNYSCSNYEELIEASNLIGYPLIVKPVDLASGTGVQKCDNYNEVFAAYNRALEVSRKNTVILEKFIIGKQHACSLFLKNSKVVFFFTDNEQYLYNNYMVAGAYSFPNCPRKLIDEIIDPIERVFKELKLVDGLFHIQFIESEGHSYIIDVCRRTPGELYGKLVSDSTGIDYYGAIVDFELGHNVQESRLIKTKSDFIARECVMDNKTGVYDKTVVSDNILKYTYASYDLHKKGEIISDYLTFKSKILFLKFDDYKTMVRVLDDFYNEVKIEVE